ncbi:MAG: nucleotide sugar dehydrogenase [Saprospiraceae bacterium]|nr:nucleotide sugar dehydrogenase [Saprospiraceae bacterium]
MSTNPFTGESYTLPADADDSQSISSFLDRHSDKKCIVIQGLGFVGAVMSLVCANALTEEYAVIGVDRLDASSFWKIKGLNSGHFPIKAEDPQIESLYKQTIEKGNFLATFDPTAYAHADVIVVDINLDVDKKHNDNYQLDSYKVDLEGFKAAIESIGNNCKEDVLVLVETTVPPGTCLHLVKPIINQALEERGCDSTRWKLGHSYERVMPGPDYINSIRNFYRVYAGIDEESAKATEAFLKTIITTDEYPLTRLGNTNASEMAKVLENSYRAMNISFMVEWSRFAESAGVNLYEVVNAIRMRPTHSNMMFPGVGVGGYCLTKDPLLASWSSTSLFEGAPLEMSEKAVANNDLMPVYAFEYLLKREGTLSDRTLLLMGVSYRQDVADTRYTPVETLYNKLEAQNARILIHDPYVRHWEEKAREVDDDIARALNEEPEIVIISTGHSCYKEDEYFNKIMDANAMTIYDTVGLFSKPQIESLQSKHNVIVLGRGDL